ncbi:hypothetical protein BDA99DRAFT_527881 [Phascolomyces articulosus]|uniref:F-box domain-containing protein n=1 Tax=Phascolomyces articulosus TaxID=60185 RepID=A0AAD5P982_9FUNG|nr:hypothetical protein BDA99DRAFT_527881 [Phascolomyces articulosus]
MTITTTATQSQHFLHPLPYDIVNNIVSFLDPKACLECMAVSAIWLNDLSQYDMKHVWGRIRITDESPIYNKRWELCMGNHVKHVKLQFKDTHQQYFAMQMLLDTGCHHIQTVSSYLFYHLLHA